MADGSTNGKTPERTALGRAATLLVLSRGGACSDESGCGSERPAGLQRCECGVEFVCDFSAGKSRCWCQEFPAVMPVPGRELSLPGEEPGADPSGDRAGCLCPTCLQRAIAERTG